jgi:hypothetical protein
MKKTIIFTLFGMFPGLVFAEIVTYTGYGVSSHLNWAMKEAVNDARKNLLIKAGAPTYINVSTSITQESGKEKVITESVSSTFRSSGFNFSGEKEVSLVSNRTRLDDGGHGHEVKVTFSIPKSSFLKISKKITSQEQKYFSASDSAKGHVSDKWKLEQEACSKATIRAARETERVNQETLNGKTSLHSSSTFTVEQRTLSTKEKQNNTLEVNCSVVIKK